MAQQTERLDKYLIGVLILTVLQFLDVAFTKIILASGYGEEINPITRQIMESTSMDIMFGVKLGTACFALSIIINLCYPYYLAYLSALSDLEPPQCLIS